MKIVYAEENNEESKEQKFGLFNEVSSDSNSLFQQTTKEEREAAENKFRGIYDNRAESHSELVQGEHNTAVQHGTENTQPNIIQPVQSAIVPQNIVVQENQNEVMNPVVSQRGEQKERHHHRYCSIPFDDSIGCVTYIVKVNTNAEDRVTMSEYSMLSRKLRNESKKDTVDIAYMYINSVKDYDTKYQLDIGILSSKAAEMQRGGMFNYTPCIDDNNIDRVLIGTDEKGRGVYWSIGHDDLGNGHMLVNGNSGMGKSTAVNLIIKKLLEKNKNIVYVDFSRSAIPERLEKSGMDKAFQNENIFRVDIESVLENHSELENALDFMVKDKKILLFEKKKHDSDVEDFLMLLYDAVVENSTLSIFLVIDEAHELDYKKGSPLYHIMEKGRGNGISLISIFQGPHETESKKQYSMMNQADIRLIFNLSDQNDARSIAESDGLKPPGKFVDKIRDLKKRHCLVIGRLEDDRNELSNNRFIEVEIPDIRK